MSAFTSLFAMISWFTGAGAHPTAVHAAAAPTTSTRPTVTHPAITHPVVTHASITHPAATHPALTHPAATVSAVSPVHVPSFGVYAGPASKGVSGAAAFGALTGTAPTGVLDFASTRDWAGITGPNWLLDPRVGSSARLEYSLPMFPDGNQYSLAACAAGAYNAEWKLTAQSLVSHHLANTIVRPGWEFNGTWYYWSAKNDINGFVGCFRQIVTTMRSVPGQHLAFDWNPNVGVNAFPAEQAYPGNGYVDYVGVDIYDTSWSHYPSSQPAAAQAAAWNDDLNGNHGLAFWSNFAKAHHKPMAITEWGVASLTNGHGGNDDPAFVDHVFDFLTATANNVAYGHYFDWTSGAGDHKLTGATRFPSSAAEYRRRTQLLPKS